jgi:hypothetical protein
MRLIISTIVTNACKTFSSIIVLPTQIDLIMNSAIQPFLGCACFVKFGHPQLHLFLGVLPLRMTIMLLVDKQCTARDYNDVMFYCCLVVLSYPCTVIKMYCCIVVLVCIVIHDNLSARHPGTFNTTAAAM